MRDTPPVVTRLIDDLRGEDALQQAQAAFALSALGEPVVAALVALLRQPDAELRKRAAWVLGVIGAPALPTLLALAEGDEQPLRVEAIRVLGVVGEARALNNLLLGLADTDDQIAARSARALGKIGDPRAYHALITALRHPAPNVRYEACCALADLCLVEAVPALERVATQDDARTSWGVAVAAVARRAVGEIRHADRVSSAAAFEQLRHVLDNNDA